MFNCLFFGQRLYGILLSMVLYVFSLDSALAFSVGSRWCLVFAVSLDIVPWYSMWDILLGALWYFRVLCLWCNAKKVVLVAQILATLT